MTKTVTAVFNTREQSDSALHALDLAGFSKNEVNVLVTPEARGKHFGIAEHTKAEEGAASGAAIGGLTGALYLGLASAGALVIPGLNLIASGALIGALAGLGAGAAAGGLVGTLVGLGIPEHEAKLYDETVRKGAILMAVEAGNDKRVEKVKEILKSANARNITALAA